MKMDTFPLSSVENNLKQYFVFFNFGEKPHFENDRLSKIRMILDHLSDVVRELVTPEKNISID